MGGRAPADSVRGLTVTLTGSGHSTITDAAGRFLIRDVAPATYALIVSAGVNQVAQRMITVSAGRMIDVTVDLAIEGAHRLPAVRVTAATALHVMGNLDDVHDGVIYAGKKTAVILMDSLRANTAQDVERQILGRVPGANFSQTEAAGFPSNGVAFRGLDPTQSVELNVRQDGVNIAGDIYGYPETYYTPPADALERIEVVQGASALAFGPQFGGVINYVMRQGTPNTAPQFTTRQTGGSFGLFNSYNALGGGSGPLTYYAFVDYRSNNGWRPNNDYRQVATYAGATFHASNRLTVGAEFTLFRNRIHMPGGLTDAEFAADPTQSFRSRNWLASPWNVSAIRATYDISPRASLNTVVSYVASDRHLVWRNEDGGPAAPDSIDPATGTFAPREVERETFHNATLESRLRVDESIFGRSATLAAGIRTGSNFMRRFEGGPGSTGTDFNMNLYGGTWEKALRFHTTNLAAFAEQLVRVSDRLSVTPGVRMEYVRSTAAGYTDVTTHFAPRTFAYPLTGVGAQYATSTATVLYANASQAYRPILYESLTPFGTIARVDPSLHASRGYSTDLGWRGTVAGVVKFDVDGFYLWYGSRVGVKTVSDSSVEFAETANIGNSVHKGVEAYAEFDPLAALGAKQFGTWDLFASFAFIDARYVSGEFAGHRVEEAPRVLARTGLTFGRGPVSMTAQASYTSSSFGDANNSVTPSGNAEAGLVPAYTVLDVSGRFDLTARYALSLGINNLANTRYFTKRTGEYPGPGILPGIGRSVYGGISARY